MSKNLSKKCQKYLFFPFGRSICHAFQISYHIGSPDYAVRCAVWDLLYLLRPKVCVGARAKNWHNQEQKPNRAWNIFIYPLGPSYQTLKWIIFINNFPKIVTLASSYAIQRLELTVYHYDVINVILLKKRWLCNGLSFAPIYFKFIMKEVTLNGKSAIKCQCSSLKSFIKNGGTKIRYDC